jgi:hypothetical protein
MKGIALSASLALALVAPAFAQNAAQTDPEQNPPPTADQPAAKTQPAGFHSTTVYHGPHRYPRHTRGRAGDPPIVDHSADTLVVEPTHSTITIAPPAVQ